MIPDLPDFLRAEQGETLVDRGWKDRKLTKQGAGFKAPASRQEEAATRQLRKELEKQAAEKQAARLAQLRELREMRRQK